MKYAKLALLLIGLSLAVALSFHYYGMRTGEASVSSLCNISDTVSCDKVAASRYAEIIPGWPLSSAVAGWFLGLLILLMLDAKTLPPALFVGLNGLALAFSGAYLVIMLGFVKSICIQCLGIDFVNSGLFVISFLEWSRNRKAGAKASSPASFTTPLLIVAASVGFVSLFLKTYDAADLPGITTDEIVQSISMAGRATPVLPAASLEGYPILGNPNAPRTIVEYSDFQCPHCKVGAARLRTVLNRYVDQVRIVFRSFPLDPSCNSEMKGGGHRESCEATRVAFCADKQKKFRPVFEAIFDNQEKLGPGVAISLAIEAGVNEAELKTCMESAEIKSMISRAIEDARLLKVESTPTYFLDGYKIQGAMPVKVWNALIEQLK